MKLEPPSVVATLIGEVVAYRQSADRAALHRSVTAALAEGTDDALNPPALTVGDEFQGTYRSVGAAIDATLAIRLAAGRAVDIRFGIGWGSVTVLDDCIHEGPGWWAAREAIEWTAESHRQTTLSAIRTAFRNAGPGGPDEHVVNAALMRRDQLLGSLDERAGQLLQGLLSGKTMADFASIEGVSASCCCKWPATTAQCDCR